MLLAHSHITDWRQAGFALSQSDLKAGAQTFPEDPHYVGGNLPSAGETGKGMSVRSYPETAYPGL